MVYNTIGKFSLPEALPDCQPEARFLFLVDMFSLECTRNWVPGVTIKKIAAEIIDVLANPNADQAANADVSSAYKANREAFEATARQWTTDYAH